MNLISLDSVEYEDAGFYPLTPVQPLHCALEWSPRMAFDIAMGDNDESVRQRYNLDYEVYERILAHPAFRKEVDTLVREVREKGVTFKAKARIQAEEYLEVVNDMVADPAVANTLKLDAIKSVVKWAEYDAPSANGPGGSAPQFNIQINL
jgi:hypothetical protein